ncbi:MAG: sulfatase-like hydrolase/transferase [Acidobacteria bacterium]|nr:sulfatase-like hydrolase/transferase [Acidobacteriota bacterium]
MTRVLNVIAATLVIINAASIVQTAARRPRIPAGEDVRTSRPAAARPDIYYLVLDAYARADVLSEVFGFDNTPFVRGLEARGFTVAGRSYANYNLTQQSLASTLNMTYLDGLAKDVGYASSDREPLYAMIRGNRVMAFLKSQGYRVVTVSSSIEPTDFRGVDRYFGFALSESEFRSVLLDTTPWPLFFGSRRSAESYDAHRGRILNAFRSLEEAPYEKGPFFMFVHIMAPHPPFVLGPNGEAREPNYLFSMVDADRLHGNEPRAVDDYIVRYREQLAFLNTRILAAVDAILARSADPPVIVIQGDHGSRAYADLDRPEASYLEENLAILNAFHLPGPAGGSAYPEITPVNTFRLIFRGYFNADLELLPDASAWTTWRRPYRFLPFDVKAYTGSIGSAKAERRPEAPAVQRR